MPYSASSLDALSAGLFQILNPRTVLDIGAGAGKYGHMIRNVLPHCEMTAVEIDPEYIETFSLRDVYNSVIEDDVLTLLKTPKIRYDMVVIGDCIEHIRKSAALDLLEFLVYRCQHIMVVYPYKFLQDDTDGHAQEAHISIWKPQDFDYLGAKSCTLETSEGWSHHLTMVPGFIPSGVTVDSITPTSASVTVGLGG